MALAEDEHQIQTLGSGRPDPSLGDGVGARRSEWGADLRDAEIVYAPWLSETAMGAGPSSDTDSILSGEFCKKGQQPKIADEELPHIRKIHLQQQPGF